MQGETPLMAVRYVYGSALELSSNNRPVTCIIDHSFTFCTLIFDLRLTGAHLRSGCTRAICISVHTHTHTHTCTHSI